MNFINSTQIFSWFRVRKLFRRVDLLAFPCCQTGKLPRPRRQKRSKDPSPIQRAGGPAHSRCTAHCFLPSPGPLRRQGNAASHALRRALPAKRQPNPPSPKNPPSTEGEILPAGGGGVIRRVGWWVLPIRARGPHFPPGEPRAGAWRRCRGGTTPCCRRCSPGARSPTATSAPSSPPSPARTSVRHPPARPRATAICLIIPLAAAQLLDEMLL